METFTLADLFIIAVAMGASLLTLVSGFGLGTMLLPAFALFFPLELAVAMTAVVHLLNNGFKFGLLWKHVHLGTLIRFGVPGMLGACLGAGLLNRFEASAYVYPGILHPVSVTALVIGALMGAFAILELSPAASRWSLPSRYVVPGGLLSGFFGGLSGHQGALRSVFLLRAGLSKEVFIATGVAIALLVDLTRIPLYLHQLPPDLLRPQWPLLALCTMSAFLGAWLGKRWIPKITMPIVQRIVGGLMGAIALALVAGLI